MAMLTSTRVASTVRRVNRNTPVARTKKPLEHTIRYPSLSTTRTPTAELTIIASIIGVSTCPALSTVVPAESTTSVTTATSARPVRPFCTGTSRIMTRRSGAGPAPVAQAAPPVPAPPTQ